jgi:A/G-specific adenine glycosylase
LTDLPCSPTELVARLLAWYGRSGRDLPWRHCRDPYRIWLSEIMLQQTTVAAVIGYYQRFLDRFPTVDDLAAAPLEDVIDLWAGLGYYSRARNLHAAARLIVDEFGGVFPAEIDTLQKLPGVGRSTAGAILALAFDRRAPILDGNVRRVLCRLFALQEPPRTTSAEKQLWHWSEQMTPTEQVHDYTQAIMDLGAMVCVPRKPLCGECPWGDVCLAKTSGLENRLPLKQPAKKIPTRAEVTLLLHCRGQYLARRRPAEGFLGGLWEFPAIAATADAKQEEKLSLLCADFGCGTEVTSLGNIRHIYSHFRLQADIYQVDIADRLRRTEGEYRWFSLEELKKIALHGAHKKVLMVLVNIGT